MVEETSVGPAPGEGKVLGGAFFATPHLGPDFGGPVDRPFRPFPDPADMTDLAAMLAASVTARGEAVATEDDRGALSFAKLLISVSALARALSEAERKGPVGLLLGSEAAYVAGVFACVLAGRVCVLLDEAAPAARTLELLGDTGAALLLARAETNRRLPPTPCPKIDLEEALQTGSARSVVGDARLGLDAPAFVLCTSGSSGRPKLIAHSQRTMFHWARTTHAALHVTEEDRALSLSPFATLGGFTALLSYPLAGAALQIMDIRQAGIAGLLKTLRERPVTILRAAPSLLRTICKVSEAREAFAGLRIVQTYGEPLTRADVEGLRQVMPQTCRLRTTYGSTEASGLSWFVDPDGADTGDYMPGGVLMPDTQAALLGEDGAACGPAEAGELVIKSRYNALGEWTRSGLTPGRLQPDPQAPELRTFATGDLARVDRHGVFVILGRIDRMVKINGMRVEPAEVEAALRRQPGVARGEIVVDAETKPARLLAFVVQGPEADAGLEANLKAALRKELPSHMVPSRIIVVDEMPLLPGGKIDQVALVARARAVRYAPAAGGA